MTSWEDAAVEALRRPVEPASEDVAPNGEGSDDTVSDGAAPRDAVPGSAAPGGAVATTVGRAGLAPAERVRWAARADCSPSALRELAHDPELLVRATVALNPRCDAGVDAILATDGDERVRALLGGRVARLLAGSGTAERDAAAQHVHRTLQDLVGELLLDEAVRVRAAVAEELAGAEAAPRELVLQLAHDVAAEVSDRVLRLSPLLEDADLLAIIASPHTASAAAAVAGRERLSATVTDAIVQQAEPPTIQALLSNQSACLREAMLDVLVGRAPDHIDWHAPLVRRPWLSAHAVRALSEFITSDLLHVLAARADLDPAKLDIVRQRLALRGREGGEVLMQQVRRLQVEGALDEAALLDAARAGDTALLMAQLAVCSGLALHKVERVLELRSAKGLVSVVWRCGFSMGLAAEIQTLLAQFGPHAAILPAADGSFPLGQDEMVWQIELMNGVPGRE